TARNYDRLGRLIHVYEYLKDTDYRYDYRYDEVGNLLQTSIEGRTLATYSYDSLNRPTRTVYPDNTTELYNYDSGSNLSAKTDRNGNLTAYSHDSLNRISNVTYYRANIGNKLSADNNTYDNNGNLVKLRSQNATIIYQYDHRNRMTAEGYSINGGCIQ